jgi:hypothetical protein
MALNWTRMLWVAVVVAALTGACSRREKRAPAAAPEPTAANPPAQEEPRANTAAAPGQPPQDPTTAATDDRDDDRPGRKKGRKGKRGRRGGRDRDGDGIPDRRQAKQGGEGRPGRPGGPGGPDGPGGPPNEPTAAPPDGKDAAKTAVPEGSGKKAEKVFVLRQARMEFNHPGAGWTHRKMGAWHIFRPNDRTGVLGIVEFDRPDEDTSRIGEMAMRLELSNIRWQGTPDRRRVGPQRLKARFAEGSCRLENNHPGEIEYYSIEGAVLIVYAHQIDAKKARRHEKVATKSVHTLRRL